MTELKFTWKLWLQFHFFFPFSRFKQWVLGIQPRAWRIWGQCSTIACIPSPVPTPNHSHAVTSQQDLICERVTAWREGFGATDLHKRDETTGQNDQCPWRFYGVWDHTQVCYSQRGRELDTKKWQERWEIQKEFALKANIESIYYHFFKKWNHQQY